MIRDLRAKWVYENGEEVEVGDTIKDIVIETITIKGRVVNENRGKKYRVKANMYGDLCIEYNNKLTTLKDADAGIKLKNGNFKLLKYNKVN